MPSLSPLTIVAITLISLYMLKWLFTKPSLPLPPGPPALPIIGNAHQAPKSRSWLQYQSWSRTYGPVVHLNMLGQHVIILSSSQAAHDVLAKQGVAFSDRPRFVVSTHLTTNLLM